MVYTINELKDLERGKKVVVKGLVSKKDERRDKNGKGFIVISLQDKTGKLETPLWDNFDNYQEMIQESQVIQMSGSVDFYNSVTQIKNPTITILQEDYKEYVPKYEISKEIIADFVEIVNGLEDKYKAFVKRAIGMDKFKLDRWHDFISAPAAEKHHHNKIGGLFLHTYGVVKAVQSIMENYFQNSFHFSAEGVVNPDRLIVSAILHDYKKVEEYEWKAGNIKRAERLLGHRELGIAYVYEINTELGGILGMEDIEAIAYNILSHHGQYGQYELKSAENKILHSADLADSQLVGEIEGK